MKKSSLTYLQDEQDIVASNRDKTQFDAIFFALLI